MSATKLVNYQHGMSRERFKQEAALIVLTQLMASVGHKIHKRFETTKPEQLAKALAQWEETRARTIGGVVEAIADAVTQAMGPDVLPKGHE